MGRITGEEEGHGETRRGLADPTGDECVTGHSPARKTPEENLPHITEAKAPPEAEVIGFGLLQAMKHTSLGWSNSSFQ